MNWLDALNKFFKVKDVYDKIGDVKKVHDYGKKISKKKSLSWDDLKYFKNDHMEVTLKNAKKAVKAADAALKIRVVWPDPGTQGRYSAAIKVVDKHGHKSTQAKAVLEAYRKDLVDYDKKLIMLVGDLEKRQKQIVERLKTAKALQEYGRVLHDAFMTCAKIPNPTGTAQNATFFSLAQDAQHFAGHIGSLASRLEKLRKKNAGAMSEGKQLISENKPWIIWAKKDATKEKDTLKKNAKAKKPKK
ncbi:MAG: hypothetical protein AB3N21_06300 [Ruegeria sp.]|uniref:hypothetical protein n=1 Tax=Ruegeria sp. TaxID=1879320 RepID=UPI00349EA206